MRLWRWPYARCVLEFSDFSLNNVLLSSQLLHISSYFIHFTQNLVLSTSKHTRQYSLHASETLIIIPWISLTAILTFAYEILPLHHSFGVAVTNSNSRCHLSHLWTNLLSSSSWRNGHGSLRFATSPELRSLPLPLWKSCCILIFWM